MAKALRVEVIGDASSYQRALGTAKTETSSFGSTVGKTFGKAVGFLGIAVGTAQLVKFGAEAVKQAAQVQKFEEAVKANFGSAAGSVLEFADSAPKLGLVDDAALSTAASFGILFKNLGIGQGKAAEMTVGWEKLGTSIAAIKGQDPAAVISKLTLAAAGNTRGLKAMGIVVDQVSLKQEAFRMGLTKTATQALTPGQKALAIYSLATKHLGEFQKQAAAHAGDFTNKQRVLNAEWDQAKEQLGTALLPVMTRLVTILADNLPGAIEGVKAGVQALAPAFKVWEAGMLMMITPLRVIIDLLRGDWAGAWDAAKAPVMLLVDAIKGAFSEPAAWLLQAGQDIISGLWSGITTEWAAVTAWLGSVQTLILGYFTGALTWLTQAGTDLLTGLWTAITGVWNTMVSWFRTIRSLFTGFFSGAVTWLLESGRNVLSGLSDGIHAVWTTLAGWLGGASSRIQGFFAGAAGWLVGEGRSVITGLFDGLKAAWQTVTGWLSSVPGWFRGFFGGAGGWLVAAGRAVIQGLWDGMKAVWNDVTGWLSGLGGTIGDLKGPLTKDRVLLHPQGRAIIQGLHRGMLSAMPELERFVSGIGPSMQVGMGSGGYAARSGYGGGGTTVVVHHTSTLDGQVIARSTQKYFNRYKAANGSMGLA